VIKTYGDTTKYLLQKNFISDLEKLLPRRLAMAFNILSNEVFKTKEKASKSGIKIKHDGNVIKVTISVSPLVKDAQKLLMVTFSEDKSEIPARVEEPFDEKIYLNQYTLNLEKELKELKIRLQSTYDQLDLSNDNMQSFNEELLSANEEMQSTNEEMQSVNEELHTINSEYQIKNTELIEINDDLNNYFRSNTNGQLFINNDLLLMKFSAGTVKQINLRESDIGRPLSNISTNIKFETIAEDIKQVIADGNTITKEIETDNGNWYQVMTMPYIQADNKRNGAVITFNDITELKKTQLELDTKNKSLLRINADLDNFVLRASHDLLGPLANIELGISIINELKISADPQLKKILGTVNTSFVRFRALVSDLATIGKIENDRSAIEPIDLNELIDDIELSIADRINSSDTTIIKEGDTPIYFSKRNLRSILYNLITNAIKFRSPYRPSEITISTKAIQGYSVLTVTDNGIGIPENKFEDIFNIYGRVYTNIEGQGIGLYLIRKIINAAGGKIIVESVPGKGSTFTVFFPENAAVITAINNG
jgi:two-component system CheB/CheR fusion protein